MTKRDGLSIDLRTVVILLILVNLPLWALAFFTVGQVETSVEAKIADDFRAIARKNAQTMSYAINHLVAEVATRVMVLADGELVSEGETATVVADSPAFAPQVAKILAPLPFLTVGEVATALGRAS